MYVLNKYKKKDKALWYNFDTEKNPHISARGSHYWELLKS